METRPETVREVLLLLRSLRLVAPGPREQVLIERLLRARSTWEMAELSAALASVLATSPEQWRAIRDAAHAALERASEADAEPVTRTNPLDEAPRQVAGVQAEPGPLPPREAAEAEDNSAGVVAVRRPGVRWAAALTVSLLGLALLLPQSLRDEAPPPTPDVTQAPVPRPAPVEAVFLPLQPVAPDEAAAAPVLLPREGAHVLPGEIEGLRHPALLPALCVALAFGVVLAALGARWWTLPAALGAHRARAAAARLSQRAELAELGADADAVYHIERYSPLPQAAIDDACGLLSRTRRAGPGDELDVIATIERAVRNGGRLIPARASRRQQVELLVLLDQEDGDHPMYDAAVQVLHRWSQGGARLIVQRYAWRLEPARIASLARTAEGLPLLLISRLSAPHGQRRSARAWLQLLRVWPRRALLDLDPRAPAERSGPARAALADLAAVGLARFPFTAAGLHALASHLGDGPPPSAPAPELPAVPEHVLELWATCAAFVPDPSWIQLEAIRRQFPEIHAHVRSVAQVQLLLDWVMREGRPLGLLEEPVRDNGARLDLPPALKHRLIEARRARDLWDHPDNPEARVEVRARRLLLAQLRAANPSLPLDQATRRAKIALHETILDRSKASALLAELACNPQHTELAEEVRAELDLQAKRLHATDGLRRVEREALADAASETGPTRIPRPLLLRPAPTKARGPALLAGALVGLSWGTWAVVHTGGRRMVNAPEAVVAPASWRLVGGGSESLGLSPRPALANTQAPIQFLRVRGGRTWEAIGEVITRIPGDDSVLDNTWRLASSDEVVPPFEVAVDPITWHQWREVMGELPEGVDLTAQLIDPATVSGAAAMAFLDKLSVRENRTPCYSAAGVSVATPEDLWLPHAASPECTGYRLLQESEWRLLAHGDSASTGDESGASAPVEHQLVEYADAAVIEGNMNRSVVEGQVLCTNMRDPLGIMVTNSDRTELIECKPRAVLFLASVDPILFHSKTATARCFHTTNSLIYSTRPNPPLGYATLLSPLSMAFRPVRPPAPDTATSP